MLYYILFNNGYRILQLQLIGWYFSFFKNIIYYTMAYSNSKLKGADSNTNTNNQQTSTFEYEYVGGLRGAELNFRPLK